MAKNESISPAMLRPAGKRPDCGRRKRVMVASEWFCDYKQYRENAALTISIRHT